MAILLNAGASETIKSLPGTPLTNISTLIAFLGLVPGARHLRRNKVDVLFVRRI